MNHPDHLSLPDHFADESRVWIYQSNRAFNAAEQEQVNTLIQQFVQAWQSHGTPVKGFATLAFNQFIVLLADETATGVSGCSTDSSVRLIKTIEATMQVDLFNRQQLAFLVNDTVQVVAMADLQQAVNKQQLKPSSIYFNNTVLSKKDMLENWMTPIEKSWLAKRISWPAFA